MSRVNLCPSLVDKFKKDILLGYILDILIKFTYYFDLEKSNLVNWSKDTYLKTQIQTMRTSLDITTKSAGREIAEWDWWNMM